MTTHADLVIRNATIYTVDPQRPWAQCIAVAGDRIIAIGSAADVDPLVNENTTDIDAQGRMVLPGFVESHWHLSSTALFEGADLSALEFDAVITSLTEWVRAYPQEQLIMSAGWVAPVLPSDLVRRETLDAIADDRPIVLFSSDAHTLWVNSFALDLANITADTPTYVTPTSWFEKDKETREPTGIIVDIAAQLQMWSALRDAGYIDDLESLYTRSIGNWLPRLTAEGVTTIFDAGFLDLSGQQELLYTVLETLDSKGELTIRVAGSQYFAFDGMSASEVAADIDRIRSERTSELIRPGFLKLFVDGIETAHSAYLLEDYADDPGNRGDTPFTLQSLAEMIEAADAMNIDVMLHCTGDAAVRLALDALEEVQRVNPPRDRRHTITHAFLTDPADIPRFRELGVIANTQLQWGIVDPYNEVIRERYGDERWGRMFAFRSFIEQGVTVSLGMDALFCQCRRQHRPVEQIESGHTRKTVGESDAIPLPGDQFLSIPQLIEAYTINGAFQLGLEDEIGSLRVGKKADLIVLERNLFHVAPSELADVDVRLTVMNGRVTHNTFTL